MTKNRAKVVIIGAGFGGLEAAKALRRVSADVTVIDRQNHHCFQPLLYQARPRRCLRPKSPGRSAASCGHNAM